MSVWHRKGGQLDPGSKEIRVVLEYADSVIGGPGHPEEGDLARNKETSAPSESRCDLLDAFVLAIEDIDVA